MTLNEFVRVIDRTSTYRKKNYLFFSFFILYIKKGIPTVGKLTAKVFNNNIKAILKSYWMKEKAVCIIA